MSGSSINRNIPTYYRTVVLDTLPVNLMIANSNLLPVVITPICDVVGCRGTITPTYYEQHGQVPGSIDVIDGELLPIPIASVTAKTGVVRLRVGYV